jgi:hypothetical protein
MLLPQARSEPTEPLAASTTVRPALGGLALSATGSLAKPANGARSFAVFSDADAAPAPVTADWEDVGTVRSRKQENTVDAVPWIGERMPMSASQRGVDRIEVFRDEVRGARHALIRRLTHTGRACISSTLAAIPLGRRCPLPLYPRSHRGRHAQVESVPQLHFAH